MMTDKLFALVPPIEPNEEVKTTLLGVLDKLNPAKIDPFILTPIRNGKDIMFVIRLNELMYFYLIEPRVLAEADVHINSTYTAYKYSAEVWCKEDGWDVIKSCKSRECNDGTIITNPLFFRHYCNLIYGNFEPKTTVVYDAPPKRW